MTVAFNIEEYSAYPEETIARLKKNAQIVNELNAIFEAEGLGNPLTYAPETVTFEKLSNNVSFKDSDKDSKFVDFSTRDKKELFCNLDVTIMSFENFVSKMPSCKKDSPFSSGVISKLDLNNNRLKEIPKKLKYLDNMVALDLSNNNITEIPEIFGTMTQLTRLDLTNNGLTSLPKSLHPKNNPRLREVYLEQGNNFPYTDLEIKRHQFRYADIVR